MIARKGRGAVGFAGMADDGRMLAQFLAERDEPCPSCGYSLRGLTTATCPECRQELRLRVGLVEPRMKLYLLGLVGLSAGVGFNAIVLDFLARRAG